MKIALFLPFSPLDAANSGVARLEMFRYFPDAHIDIFHFGPATDESISIGDYFPEASPRNFSSYFRLLKAFKAKHEKESYDVIWTTMPPVLMALFTRRISRKMKVPFIVDVRDPGIASAIIFNSKTSARYRIAHRLEQWLYKGAARICVTTPELAQLLHTEFGVDIDRTTVISNATVEKVPSTKKVDPKKLRVFYAGTFAPYQVIDPLVDNLLKEHLPQFEFDFYGYKQEANPALKERIAAASAEKWLHLHPRLPRTELFKKLEASDIVLVPIELKGNKELYDYAVPLKLYEALAFSKPILLFGGTKASVRVVEETGIGEVSAVADPIYPALKKLAENYSTYQKAAEKTVFSREAEAKKLHLIIERLTSKAL